MQALVKYAPGAGNMEIRQIPEPVPGPGQVLLKVAYAGICGSDMHIYSGAIEFKKYPLVPGHEISGTIAGTGPGVKDWRVGERVTTEHTFSTCGQCLYCPGANTRSAHPGNPWALISTVVLLNM
ncbi:MAG: L-iditol 2-dehydrogenase [Moorella sp. (in: firmicutes)]|nr:L-iditol 2-dehydrogenase [Moorella sp. (in: firmicutes)]